LTDPRGRGALVASGQKARSGAKVTITAAMISTV